MTTAPAAVLLVLLLLPTAESPPITPAVPSPDTVASTLDGDADADAGEEVDDDDR